MVQSYLLGLRQCALSWLHAAPPGEYDWTCASFGLPCPQPKWQIDRLAIFAQVTEDCRRTDWRHLANTIELVHPSAHWSLQPKTKIDRFNHFLHSSWQLFHSNVCMLCRSTALKSAIIEFSFPLSNYLIECLSFPSPIDVIRPHALRTSALWSMPWSRVSEMAIYVVEDSVGRFSLWTVQARE